MTRLSLQVFYLWRHVSSSAPPLILWWSNSELLVGPLHRSSPFIGELRCQAIQIEHGPYITERTQKSVYFVRCLWLWATVLADCCTPGCRFLWTVCLICRLGTRVETKIFVFVFSRKFCENLFSFFAKKSNENKFSWKRKFSRKRTFSRNEISRNFAKITPFSHFAKMKKTFFVSTLVGTLHAWSPMKNLATWKYTITWILLGNSCMTKN
jgi:hypothetical protein